MLFKVFLPFIISSVLKSSVLFLSQIMQRASETLIPVTLELGGKDSFIVCEDVDLPNVRAVCSTDSIFSSITHYAVSAVCLD
jgi:hypothetical protein